MSVAILTFLALASLAVVGAVVAAVWGIYSATVAALRRIAP